MNLTPTSLDLRLRDTAPADGFGLLYAIRTARAWWYSAWLRTLARFSRTFLGSFWLGLSNLLSVALLGAVYGAVLKVPNPYDYVIYLGLGLTVWGLISMSVVSGCALFTARRDHLVNNALPAIFYCLEEWAFQLQTFIQAFAMILVGFAFISPAVLLHSLTSLWLPLLNLGLFCFWVIVVMAVLGSRFKDVGQLMPILLQLMFLVSPILYQREVLGTLGVLADLNPFYRILAPLRSAVIDGTVNLSSELLTLVLNVLLVFVVALWLKRLRYRLPLWV
jgi:ABC-type polysaccharide/polyol phosphate export permease